MRLLVPGGEGGVGPDVVQERNQTFLAILCAGQLDLGKEGEEGSEGGRWVLGRLGPLLTMSSSFPLKRTPEFPGLSWDISSPVPAGMVMQSESCHGRPEGGFWGREGEGERVRERRKEGEGEGEGAKERCGECRGGQRARPDG